VHRSIAGNIQCYNGEPSPRPLGSGILKILFFPKLLHDDILYRIIFICHSQQPVCGLLLWGPFIGGASYNGWFFFVCVSLPCTGHSLSCISLLSTISCEVTWFSTEEAGEDFPSTVFLYGSSGYSPFPTSSYTLFIVGSSWKEVFCFHNSCVRSSWRCVHCIWIMLGVSPLCIEASSWYWWVVCFCFCNGRSDFSCGHRFFAGRWLLPSIVHMWLVECFRRCTRTSCWGVHW
jgi:hypothetical protein